MLPHAIDYLSRLVNRLDAEAGRLVIDADAHITDLAALPDALRARYEGMPAYYHGRPISAEELLAEMDMAEVDMALVWQNPAATSYTDDAGRNTELLLAANLYVRDSAWRYPERLIPAGWVDPKACGLGNTLAMVEALAGEFGLPIVKMNPAQNRYPIDSPDVLEVLDRIVECGAVPAFHFGADTTFTPAEGLRRVALRHPEHPLIAVHMGGGGASYLGAEELYRSARALGLECRNIRYVLSAKRDPHIESDLIAYQMAGEPFRSHLFCASDAPYGRLTWNFGGFRAMLNSLVEGARHTDPIVRANPGMFTPGDAQRYLGGNFAHFASASCARLLATAKAQWAACR
jgi:predicted TIM-barrel fold metal-dependent hydrolase